MKVKIEIDCTPEEARNFMGLPEIGLNFGAKKGAQSAVDGGVDGGGESGSGVDGQGRKRDGYVDTLTKVMKGAESADQLQEYAKQFAPMGQAGLKLFQSLVENSQKSSAKDSSSGGNSENSDQNCSDEGDIEPSLDGRRRDSGHRNKVDKGSNEEDD